MTVPTAEVPTGSLLEVWGDPIAHSLSPRIHAAAYAALGWDWTYGRRRVAAADFSRELGGLGAAFRGLSLTFPLKTEAFAAATHRDRTAELTGAVNTLVRAAGQWRGFNTDVGGIVGDVRAHGLEAIETGASARGRRRRRRSSRSHSSARARSRWSRDAPTRPRPRRAGERLSVAVSIAAPDTVARLPSAHRLHPARRRPLPDDTADGSRPAGAALRRRVRPLADPAGRRVAGDGAPAVNGLGMLVRQAAADPRVPNGRRRPAAAR
jgi:shikimate dehydrogenase